LLSRRETPEIDLIATMTLFPVRSVPNASPYSYRPATYIINRSVDWWPVHYT
jgi:hypothetical protein